MKPRVWTIAAGVIAASMLMSACGGGPVSDAVTSPLGMGEPSASAIESPSASAASAVASPADSGGPIASASPEAGIGVAAAAAPPPTLAKALACQLTAGAACNGADLSGRDLTGMNLAGISLRGANLTRAVLDTADLSRADLTYADLTGATVRNATFTTANLRGAILRGATLTSANLTDAVADSADFTGANLTGAVLTGANLRSANLTDAVVTTADPRDAMFTLAKMCHTKMAGGVIDSRSCPCTGAGGGTAGSWDSLTLGSMGLGVYPFTPRGYAPAQGQMVPVQQSHPLFALVGSAWGYEGGTRFGLPKVTGPWAGIRTGPDGTGTCLQWSVGITGVWPMGGEPLAAYPGQVLMSAVTASPMRPQMLEWGASVSDLSALLGKSLTAYQIPAGWSNRDVQPMVGELRLFNNSFPLPDPFVPADGRAAPSDANGLRALIGSQLPQVVAPDGYTWAMATAGDFPSPD